MTAASVPDVPARYCTQQSVTIKFDDVARSLHAFPVGSPEWVAHNGMRSIIEGFNGFVKDTAREALAQPGRRRLRDRTAQNLLCAFLFVAANLRKSRPSSSTRIWWPTTQLWTPTQRSGYGPRARHPVHCPDPCGSFRGASGRTVGVRRPVRG